MASDTSSEPAPPPARGGCLRRLLLAAAALLVAALAVPFWVWFYDPAAPLRWALGRAGPGVTVASISARTPLDVDLAGVAYEDPEAGLQVEVARVNLAADLGWLPDLLAGQVGAPRRARVAFRGLRARHQGQRLVTLTSGAVSATATAALPGPVLLDVDLGPGSLDPRALAGARRAATTTGEGEGSGWSASVGRVTLTSLTAQLGAGQGDLVVPAAHLSPRRVRADLRASRGGSGQLDLARRGSPPRWGGTLDVEGLTVTRLALPLARAVEVSGGLAAALQLDLDPEDLQDLAACRGTASLRGVEAWVEGRRVLGGLSLDASLATTGARLEATASRLAPAGVLRALDVPAPGPLSGTTKLDLEARGSPARGRAEVSVETPDLDLLGLPVKRAAVRASWTTTGVEVTRLELALRGGEAGALEGEGGWDRTRDRVRGALRARGWPLDLGPAAAAGLAGRVEGAGRWEAPRAAPLEGSGGLELTCRGARLGDMALGTPAVKVEVTPDAVTGRVDLAVSGPAPGRARVDLRATRQGAKLDLGLRDLRASTEALGFVTGAASLSLRGTLAGAPPPASVAALEAWVDQLRPGAASPPAVTWSLDGLRIRAEEGLGLVLEEALGGAVDLAAGTLAVEGTEVQLGPSVLRFGGVVGPGEDHVLRAELVDVPLGPLADAFAAEAGLSAAGTLQGAEVEARALSGAPRWRASATFDQPTTVARWDRDPLGLRRRAVELPAGTLRAEGAGGGVTLEGAGLRVRRDGKAGGVDWRAEGVALRLRETRPPAKAALRDLKVVVYSRGQLDLARPADLAASLGLSVENLRPTSETPARVDLRLEVDPQHVQLSDLAVRDGAGATRVQGALSLARTRPGTASLRLDALPLAWFGGPGLAIAGLDRLDLALRGETGPLGGEVPLVRHLASLSEDPKWLRRVGWSVHLDRFEARAGDQVRVGAPSPFSGHFEVGRFRLDRASLDVAGHRLTAAGELGVDTPSDFEVATDEVELADLLALVVPGLFPGTKGALKGQLRLRGTAPDLRGEGGLTLEGLDLLVPPFENRLKGSVRLRSLPQGLRLDAPGLALGETPLVLEGGVEAGGDGRPRVRVKLEGAGLRLRRGRSGLNGVSIFQQLVADPGVAPRVEVKVGVGDGVLVLDNEGPVNLLRRLTAQRADERGVPLPGPVHLRVDVAGPLRVKSPLLDASLRGYLEARMAPGAPAFLEGELEATAGSVFLHSTEFRLTRARTNLRLDGEALTSRVDLVAEAKVRNHSVTLKVEGPVDGPLVTLTSSPARNEAALIQLLTTGTLPGEAGALTGVGTGVRDFYVTSALNRFLSASFGASAVRLRNDGGVRRVDLDHQLNARTTVTYSVGADASNLLRVEYRLGRGTAVEAGRRSGAGRVGSFVGIKRRLRLR